MNGTSERGTPLALRLQEIVGLIIDQLDEPADVLNCACVNSSWNQSALRRLYRGSMNDLRFRTPDIGSLNSLFVASRERFAHNMSFVKHLVLAPEATGQIETIPSGHRNACVERCRPLQDRKSAEMLLRPKGRGPAHLAIPFDIDLQDLAGISELILHPHLKSLIIDSLYCEKLSPGPGHAQMPPAHIVSIA